ncbi:glycosyltransferase [Oceanicola sp. 22II-s10i]|uniref:glycosyltransferase n=1 Tax=Oceanicola sp. 22II-s10i TaxID=1317116 RepID=UPI000B5263A1|nr:glycosyltransferase [Oceanicola sp. 22II-s10i]
MRAPVSVIIPTLDSATDLPGCAAALFEGLEAGLIRELIVSDGGSGDATRKVAADLGAIWAEGASGRVAQMRRGATEAGGEWLMFLPPRVRLGPGWAEVALQHLVTDRPACFRLGAGGGPLARIGAGVVNLAVRAGRAPRPVQGLLLPRHVWAALATDRPEDALRKGLHLLPAEAVAAR